MRSSAVQRIILGIVEMHGIYLYSLRIYNTKDSAETVKRDVSIL